ncbi:enoyl-CoA hydratase/isomerase family protein [Paracoccus sp. Arc7-R13]|jgi:enoyl-CoA hydratase|uniref:enoyl-CoA hydratase/isomerase family protein n=1 Tax=Paracoccus sp. Arc7-R13 TaxID=2500532 RepID=UPI000FDB73F0|nr:enoyl-CoA hydratase/isomerase family protein [Paracoccus sp. Arc7-R13]AZY93579.1 enoyl-CoA hydratase/isomerase family protein [Paracoccus sp. Arc7-R13]
MDDLTIRTAGRAGRITFTRPKALNALTHAMARAIHDALDGWRDDPAVALVIIDAEGDRAFCAGGDIAAVYHAGRAGDHQVGRDFFRDEYRMNAAIADFPKPIVAFMQGFVMGGGVGVGGHASHRIVGDTTRIAMPESGIGLIPDVGGTWLLGRAPGRIGEYLAMTGGRMTAGDAIHAGFADMYIPEADWPGLIAMLEDSGDVTGLRGHPAPAATLDRRDLSAFGGRTLADITAALQEAGDDGSLEALRRNSPLSMAAGLAMVRAARGDDCMQQSLSREYRFTARATAESDFLEGVRAQIIDKDRKPVWRRDASDDTLRAMLAPLGDDELQWETAE